MQQVVLEFVWREANGGDSVIRFHVPMTVGHELLSDIALACQQSVKDVEDEVVLKAGYVSLLRISGGHEGGDHRSEFLGNLDFARPEIAPRVDHEVIAHELTLVPNGFCQNAHRVHFGVDQRGVRQVRDAVIVTCAVERIDDVVRIQPVMKRLVMPCCAYLVHFEVNA